MSLSWTGERLVTELDSAYGTFEHLHRYALALELCKNKNVLDIASGEGYGTNLIGSVAEFVLGVDISFEAVEHAKEKYQRENIEFKVGNTSKIPLESNTVDVVVSFETIEHIKEQNLFLSEVKRVLKKDGILIISTPDKTIYSERDPANRFHIKELFTNEFKQLISTYFNQVELYQQRIFIGSVVSHEEIESGEYLFFDGDFYNIKAELNEHNFFNKPFFNIIIASDIQFKNLNFPSISLFSAYKAYVQERERLITEIESKNRKLASVVSSPSYKAYAWIVDNFINLKRKVFQQISKKK